MSAPTDNSFYFDQAVALLAALNASFTGADAFDRSYVAIGDASEDCQQMVVGLLQIHTSSFPTNPRGDADSKNTVPVMVFRVVLTRCIQEANSRGEALAPAQLTAQAERTGKDAWMLHRFFTTKVQTGLLEDVNCGKFKIQPLIIRAQGGMASCQVDIHASL